MRLSGLLVPLVALACATAPSLAQQQVGEISTSRTLGAARPQAINDGVVGNAAIGHVLLPNGTAGVASSAEYTIIDSVQNGFSYYTLNQQPFTYDPASNLYVTIKRAGATDESSGNVYLRVSSDGGATWMPAIGPLHDETNEGGPGRYPSVALANQGGTSDLSSIYAVYMFPALTPSVAFGNMVFGIITLDGQIHFTLPFSTGINGNLWGSSSGLTITNDNMGAIGAGALDGDNFGVVSVDLETGDLAPQVPASLDAANFRPGTSTGRYSSLCGVDNDGADGAYIGVVGMSPDTATLRVAFTKSTDKGTTWSDLTWCPLSLIPDYAASLELDPANSNNITYDCGFTVMGPDHFSYLTPFYSTTPDTVTAASQLIEIEYDHGNWSIHKVADIQPFVSIFFHSADEETNGGTASQTAMENQIVRTASRNAVVAKWWNFVTYISSTDITGDGLAPDTLTASDIFVSGRTMSSGWTNPQNVTDNLFFDKLSWISNIIPDGAQSIPMLLSQTIPDGTETNDSINQYRQRLVYQPQYIVETPVSMDNVLSVQSPTASNEAITVAAYPNPTTDRVNVRYTLPQAGDVSVDVFSVTGERVLSLRSSAVIAGQHALPLDVTRFPAGSYYCRISSNGASTDVMFNVVR